jgi:hypothetical protein
MAARRHLAMRTRGNSTAGNRIEEEVSCNYKATEIHLNANATEIVPKHHSLSLYTRPASGADLIIFTAVPAGKKPVQSAKLP